MSKETQNKYLKVHKITNIIFLILLVPFLIVSLVAAIIMFNTKSSGGYANFLGYYVYEIQNDNFKKSTDMIRYDVDPYVKGAKFLFHKVSVDDLKDDQYVIFYSKAGSDTPTASTEPNWVPLNSSVTSSGVQVVGEYSDLAEMSFVQLAGKKATITTEDGKRHVVFSYYSSIVQIDDHTSAGSDLLVYDNIVGVLAEDQSTFLIGLLEFCASTTGFLTLILAPFVVLITIKLISLYYYRRYSREEELIRDTQIMTSDKVSYNQALRGARKSSAQNQSGRIISSTRSTNSQAINTSRSGNQPTKTVARTAPKPRPQTPVKRSAPKPRNPITDK